MSTHATPLLKRWGVRRIVFTILGGLVTLIFLSNLYRLTAPWAPIAWFANDDPRQLNPELHRWHNAIWGAVSGILEGGAWLSLLWRPRENPLLIQFMALAMLAAAPIILPVEPGLFVVIVVVSIAIASYPNPRAFLDFSRDEPISRPLLVLSVMTALFLVPFMVRLELWQIQGIGGEHATANQWVSDIEHTAFLLLAAFLASTKRPGWRSLGILTGVVFIYLGIAALALPGYAGSWGVIGGVAALIAGLLYLIVMIREMRKPVDSSSEVLSSVTL